MTTLLQVVRLTRRFGGYTALADVSCDVTAGTIHALIGPNGAGKTTLFNIVSGVLRPTAGTLVYAGHDYTGTRADQVFAMGIARNFQQVRLFKGLSPEALACYHALDAIDGSEMPDTEHALPAAGSAAAS